MAAIDLPGLTAKAPAGPLATLLGQTVETAQDGAIPGDFAAMLAASQTASFTPASLLPIAPAPASGKPAGKAGGKSLPDDLPLAAVIEAGSLPETEGEELAIPAEDAQPAPSQPIIAMPLQMAPQALPGETPPATEAPRATATPLPTPAALPQTIAAQVARIVAGQEGPRPAATAAKAAVQVAAAGVSFELPAAPAAQPVQPAVSAQPAAPAAAPAMAPVAALLPRGEVSPAVTAGAAAPARRTAAADTELPAATTIAAIGLPAEAMALRTDMAPAAVSPAPQAAAPAAPATPAPHDFAALVDRLVEARDAALASQAPQVVHSTLRHADFGQVSIRFETASDGLSASLSSPDPDFARAVQASAATGQGSLNTEQQGGQNGQNAQSAFTQSQQRSPGQQQPHAAEARWRDAPAGSADPRGDSSDNPTAPQGRGIYA